jgi:hypothetical protein
MPSGSSFIYDGHHQSSQPKGCSTAGTRLRPQTRRPRGAVRGQSLVSLALRRATSCAARSISPAGPRPGFAGEGCMLRCRHQRAPASQAHGTQGNLLTSSRGFPDRCSPAGTIVTHPKEGRHAARGVVAGICRDEAAAWHPEGRTRDAHAADVLQRLGPTHGDGGHRCARSALRDRLRDPALMPPCRAR